MLTNRSVPTDVLLPHLIYENVGEAASWLGRVFGFREHYRYGPPDNPQGAQMHLGSAWIMLTSAREGRKTPARLGAYTQSLTVFVDDVDASWRRTKMAGARIVEELNETMYGELQYVAEDLAGHHWLFSRHVKDVSPEEWGATIAQGAA